MNWNEFYQSVKAGEIAPVYLFTGPEAYIKREALESLLQGAWRITAEALLVRAGKAPQGDCAHHIAALSRLQDGQLAALEAIFRRYAAECVYNVGPGHVLGALLAEIQQEVIR